MLNFDLYRDQQLRDYLNQPEPENNPCCEQCRNEQDLYDFHGQQLCIDCLVGMFGIESVEGWD